MMYSLLRFVAWIYLNIIYRLKSNGSDNIPKDGRCIICANHVTFYDPVTVAIYVKRTIHFLAKKELFEKAKILNWLFRSVNCIPVDRGGSDITSLKAAFKVLKNEHTLGIFPEGTRNLDHEKVFLEPKPGVILIAVRTKSPIIPVFINIGEGFRPKVVVNFGPAIYLEEYYNRKDLTKEECIQICKDKVYTKMCELKLKTNGNN